MMRAWKLKGSRKAGDETRQERALLSENARRVWRCDLFGLLRRVWRAARVQAAVDTNEADVARARKRQKAVEYSFTMR